MLQTMSSGTMTRMEGDETAWSAGLLRQPWSETRRGAWGVDCDGAPNGGRKAQGRGRRTAGQRRGIGPAYRAGGRIEEADGAIGVGRLARANCGVARRGIAGGGNLVLREAGGDESVGASICSSRRGERQAQADVREMGNREQAMGARAAREDWVEGGGARKKRRERGSGSG